MPSPNVTISGDGPNLRTEGYNVKVKKKEKKRPVIKIYTVLCHLTDAIFRFNNCVERIITALNKTNDLPFTPHYKRRSYTRTHTSMLNAAVSSEYTTDYY